MADYKRDRWVNGHGVFKGRATFIRKNVSLAGTRKADYPTVLMVCLVYREMADNGLPGSSEELHRLDQTEEAIADHFCSRYDALFALCVTGGGTRDIFLFLPERPTEQEVAAEFDACSPSIDYDFGLRHDPEWRPFMTLLPQSDDDSPLGAAKSRLSWWKRLFG
jgi:Family of unknown function (DUF695)